MNALRSTLEIARQTLWLLLQNRLLWVVLLAELGLALLGYALGSDPPHGASGRHLFAMLTWWVLLVGLMPWTMMYFGVQAVHGDIDDRTLQYLLLRPIRRWSILLGKTLAVTALGAVLFGLGVVLLFAALALQPDVWTDGIDTGMAVVFAEAMLAATVAYAAVAVLFGAHFKRPLVWGAFFIVGLQMFVGVMPARAGIRVITITDPVRRLVLDGIEPDRRLARGLWPTERDFQPDLIGQPRLNLAVLTGVALLLAMLAYCRSEYDSRERE